MKLIFHADDFGLNHAVNHAVADAAKSGILKSASIMANGMAADEAAASARGVLTDVGVHLNIVRGRPLSAPEEVPTLVDGSGRFFNSIFKLMTRSGLGRIDPGDVYREYRRQVLFMIERGVAPAHFDGEKHSHILIPEAAEAAGRLMDEFSIHGIRTVSERQFIKRLNSYAGNVNIQTDRRAGLLFLEYRSQRARKKWGRIRSPDYTFGIGAPGAAAGKNAGEILRAILELPGEEVAEWVLHPGYPFDYEKEKFRRHYGIFHHPERRSAEAAFLLSPETAECAKTYASRFISYGDL